MAFLGIGGSKGRSRSRAGRVRQEWQDLGFAAPDGKLAGRDWFESALNSDGIDELGFTAGLPGSHIAPDVDLLSRAKVARRNDLLASTGMAQAQNYLGSAAEALSAYRPGGAAALLSGLASQQAQTALQGNLARRTEAPGLMFRYTEQVRKSAERKARNAAIAQSVIGLASAGLGAAIGGIGGAAPGGPVAETLVPGQSSGAGQQVGSQASAGPGQSPAPAVAGATQGAGGAGTQTFQGGVGATTQKSVAGGSPGIQTARGPVTAPGRGPAGAGAPGPAPGGGPAPAGGAGPAGAPGPLRRGEVTRRFGDSSMAASPSQAGFAMDTGLPADVIDTLAWAMATGDEPLSTADLFSAELDFMMSSSLLRVG